MICMDDISINRFSEEHPSDLLEKILEEGASQSQFNDIYRVSYSGACNRDAFLCTVIVNSQKESISNRDAYIAEMQKEYMVDDWSTSCWSDINRAKDLLSLMRRSADSPKILIGNILPETGYSILTTERTSVKALPKKKQRKKEHHIDWWIFDDQDVSMYFEGTEV